MALIFTGSGGALQKFVQLYEISLKISFKNREFELRANSLKNAIKIKPASISSLGLVISGSLRSETIVF